MKPNRIMCIIPAGIVAGIFMFSSCHSGYSLASVEGSRIEVTAALDANPDSAAIAVLAPYQKTVDSIMSPVIGQSARFMDRFRPESELSNLVADILRYSASAYIGRMADVGVTNMGGLRTALPEGDITYGNIYEITPFENTLCIVTMNGVLLRELFENIAAVHGEGLSGACLEISGTVGVERIFPIESPAIDSITVNKVGKVRRAKLYYLRALTGKKARIQEKRVNQ